MYTYHWVNTGPAKQSIKLHYKNILYNSSYLVITVMPVSHDAGSQARTVMFSCECDCWDSTVKSSQYPAQDSSKDTGPFMIVHFPHQRLFASGLWLAMCERPVSWQARLVIRLQMFKREFNKTGLRHCLQCVHLLAYLTFLAYCPGSVWKSYYRQSWCYLLRYIVGYKTKIKVPGNYL